MSPTTIDGRSKVPIANLSRSNSMTDRAQRTFIDGLKSMDDLHRQRHPLESELAARVESFELAYRMQAAARMALDLTQESKATHQQYGIDAKETDLVARQCLMDRKIKILGGSVE